MKTSFKKLFCHLGAGLLLGLASPLAFAGSHGTWNQTLYLSSNGFIDKVGALYAENDAKATWGGDIYLSAGSTRVGTQNSASQLTINGVIADDLPANSRSLGFTGPGTIILGAANTYKGNTSFIGSVTVQLKADNGLPTSTVITGMDANSKFDLNGFNQKVHSLGTSNVSSQITNSPSTRSTFSIGGKATDDSYAVLTGNLSLDKYGDGFFTVRGTSNYTGDTFVRKGRLTISGMVLADDSNVSVWDGGRNPFGFYGDRYDRDAFYQRYCTAHRDVWARREHCNV